MLGLLNEPGAIICSGDKDMLTLPGQHYRNGELIVVKSGTPMLLSIGSR